MCVRVSMHVSVTYLRLCLWTGSICMCVCHVSLVLCNRVNGAVANNGGVSSNERTRRFVSEKCCEKCVLRESDTFKGTLQIMQFRARYAARKYFRPEIFLRWLAGRRRTGGKSAPEGRRIMLARITFWARASVYFFFFLRITPFQMFQNFETSPLPVWKAFHFVRRVCTIRNLELIYNFWNTIKRSNELLRFRRDVRCSKSDTLEVYDFEQSAEYLNEKQH